MKSNRDGAMAKRVATRWLVTKSSEWTVGVRCQMCQERASVQSIGPLIDRRNTVCTKENLPNLVIQYIEAMRAHHAATASIVGRSVLGCADGGVHHQPAPCGLQLRPDPFSDF